MQNKERALARKLDDICSFLDRNFNINAGGCCFVASVIAYCLEQDEIDYKVGVYSEDDFDNFFDIGCESQWHYFIIVDDTIINEDVVDYYQVFNDVTSKDLLQHYQECSWNLDYKNKNNDFIEHLIKELYVKFYEDIFERESECICF